jgi:CRISPR-associated protein Cas2
MTVIILTACPPGLRGYLTQWLLEISAGVYVGHVSARVRGRLWARVLDMAGPGRALMVFQTRGEQRLSFMVHDHHWVPVDVDGVTLIRRPANRQSTRRCQPAGARRPGVAGSAVVAGRHSLRRTK